MSSCRAPRRNEAAPMLDLTYLALFAALLLLSVWMIQAFDRL